MLKGLLENKSCSKCQLCCGFDKNDIWEMPIFSEYLTNILSGKVKNVEFIKHGSSYVVKAPPLSGDELFFCPALDKSQGCILGDDKPFDCRIWPYRIMNVAGKKAITIAPVCDELFNRPLSELINFLKKGLADKIFAYANENPDIVKEYDKSYPVLMFQP